MPSVESHLSSELLMNRRSALEISGAASEGLDDLVVRIGRMIAYQEYNTKSPLNGLAAKWAAQHAELLPVNPS